MKPKTTKLAGLFACGLLVLPAISSAQTITLDHVGEGNEVGVQTGVALYDSDLLDDVTILRNDVYGRVALGKQSGIYFNLPISHVAVDAGEDETALGNIELGGFFNQRLDNVLTSYRLGILAPTADDDFDSFIANALASPARLTDMASIATDTLTLRIAASPRVDLGMGFVRADLGIDTMVPTDNGDQRDVEAFLRANVAAGVEVQKLTLALELANIGWITEEGDLGDRFMHTAAVSASYDFGPIAAVAGLATPLDEDTRGDIWVPTVGLSGQF